MKEILHPVAGEFANSYNVMTQSASRSKPQSSQPVPDKLRNVVDVSDAVAVHIAVEARLRPRFGQSRYRQNRRRQRPPANSLDRPLKSEFTGPACRAGRQRCCWPLTLRCHNATSRHKHLRSACQYARRTYGSKRQTTTSKSQVSRMALSPAVLAYPSEVLIHIPCAAVGSRLAVIGVRAAECRSQSWCRGLYVHPVAKPLSKSVPLSTARLSTGMISTSPEKALIA